MATFAEKLLKLRNLLGVTQLRLSQITKIPPSTIANWETGICVAREAGILKLEKLCAKKEIKINWRK